MEGLYCFLCNVHAALSLSIHLFRSLALSLFAWVALSMTPPFLKNKYKKALLRVALAVIRLSLTLIEREEGPTRFSLKLKENWNCHRYRNVYLSRKKENRNKKQKKESDILPGEWMLTSLHIQREEVEQRLAFFSLLSFFEWLVDFQIFFLFVSISVLFLFFDFTYYGYDYSIICTKLHFAEAEAKKKMTKMTEN